MKSLRIRVFSFFVAAVFILPGHRTAGAAEESSSAIDAATSVLFRVPFEAFRSVDWGIGHDIRLPLLDPSDQSSHGGPRNDGGDWVPFYWEQSTQSRSGRSLELRIVQPETAIRGCGVNFNFRGKNAFPPGKEIIVTVWTNTTRFTEDDFTDVGVGWHPGDYPGTIGGVQDYAEFSRRTKETGWKKQTLTFRSHLDPKIGDSIGLVFAAQTSAKPEFRPGKPSPLCDGVVPVVAAQPVLSAFFDDLVIAVVEPAESAQKN
jgi:hypothetical protein